MSTYKRDSTIKPKTINPVWRGIGCVILVILTVGGYWLAGYLIGLNLFPLPTNLDIPVGKFFTIPGKMVLQVLATGLVDVLAYGVMVMAWAVINPPKRGPLDAPPPPRRRPPSLSR